MPQNNPNPTSGSLNTQAVEPRPGHEVPSIAVPGQTKTQHNVTVVPGTENAPRREIGEQAPRKKRLSFGGGNDGRGSPMFANLESARAKHLASGYDDQKPPDGFIGAAFKRFITGNPRAETIVHRSK
ncbi:unnamed protein product [Tuber aestivum]|uniref:Uncharacterized protein n=1 Tax=Tuber aestivum TaxID=59557 RepID=A0A292PY78_9PEZI|nr:unnamed protein product [Tuber aestivum]